MYPPLWGPMFHDLLFFLAQSYPNDPTESQQQSMESLLRNLFANLPCVGCMVEASLYFHTHPPTLSSRPAFLDWVVQQHNYINSNLGKRSNWTISEAQAAFHTRHFTDLSMLTLSERKRAEDHAFISLLQSENKRLQQICLQLGRTRDTPPTQTSQQHLLIIPRLYRIGLQHLKSTLYK